MITAIVGSLTFAFGLVAPKIVVWLWHIPSRIRSRRESRKAAWWKHEAQKHIANFNAVPPLDADPATGRVVERAGTYIQFDARPRRGEFVLREDGDYICLGDVKKFSRPPRGGPPEPTWLYPHPVRVMRLGHVG